MKVLVCGASGFIGSAISRRLTQDGHGVVRGVRRPQRSEEIAIDLRPMCRRKTGSIKFAMSMR